MSSFVLALTYLDLVGRYTGTLPRMPQGAQTVPLNNHGTVVYLTSAQNYLLYGLQDGAVVIGILGALLIQSARKRN